MNSSQRLEDRELLDILIRKREDYTEVAITAIRAELESRGYATDRAYDMRKAYFGDSELEYTCGSCGAEMYVQGEELWLGKTVCPRCEGAQEIDSARLEPIDSESKKEEPVETKPATDKFLNAAAAVGGFLFYVVFKDSEPTGILGGGLKAGLGATIFYGMAWLILKLKDALDGGDASTEAELESSTDTSPPDIASPEDTASKQLATRVANDAKPNLCHRCHKRLEPDYLFCPYCGWNEAERSPEN